MGLGQSANWTRGYVLAAAAILGLATRTHAVGGPPDRITVEGVLYRGTIVGLAPEGVRFSLPHADGVLVFPYGVVDALSTAEEFRVSFGKDEVRGRLVGVEKDLLLVGDDVHSAARVRVGEIIAGVAESRYDESFWTRLRDHYRHWEATFDVGLEVDDGAVDKRKLDLRLDVERRLKPTRYTFAVDYAIETQQKGNDPSKTTKDELYSYFRGERDWMERLVGFLAAGAEWDRPRAVDIRAFPNAGLGYRLLGTDRLFLQPMAGFGFVHEEFDGFSDNDYPAALLGTDFRVKLPREASARLFFFYMPSLMGPEDDWLLRTELSLTVPIWGPVGVKARWTLVNDNNPAPEVGNNKIKTFLGTAFEF